MKRVLYLGPTDNRYHLITIKVIIRTIFFITYVQEQQPQGKLQRQKTQERNENTKIQAVNKIIYKRGNKKITPKNNSINNNNS